MVHSAKSGHPGGALSGADILTVLYNKSLNIPVQWEAAEDFATRDRFILSKGHASALLYGVLGELGFFPKELYSTFRVLGSQLQGHPYLYRNLHRHPRQTLSCFCLSNQSRQAPFQTARPFPFPAVLSSGASLWPPGWQ